jgi:hypothetical protein
MDDDEVLAWHAGHLGDFAALGRGHTDDVDRLLAWYAVPAILSTDAGCTVLADAAQVVAAARQQVEGLRAAGYDRSVSLTSATTVVNRTCALHRAAFARLRADGTEIGRVDTTDVVPDGPAGRRISALLVHPPT